MICSVVTELAPALAGGWAAAGAAPAPPTPAAGAPAAGAGAAGAGAGAAGAGAGTGAAAGAAAWRRSRCWRRGVGLGEGVEGSIRMASRLRGVGLGFARFESARTWVVARRGRRKMGMAEISILNVDVGFFCFVLPVWPTPLEPTASSEPLCRYISVRLSFPGGKLPRNRLMSLVGGNCGSKFQ